MTTATGRELRTLIDDDWPDTASRRRPADLDERAVVVCGTAGGVGTSVVSALLAEHRAASSLGLLSWWVDASGNDCDIELRLRGTGNEELLRTASGTGLWLSPEEAAVTDAVVEVWRQGAVPVVDAGGAPADAAARTRRGRPPEPHAGARDQPATRPAQPGTDHLHRMGPRGGVLEHTVVVIGSQLPVPQQKGLADMLVGGVVSGGAVGTVIGLDYDPVIGAGTALDQDARRGLLPATAEAIAKLAAATSNQR